MTAKDAASYKITFNFIGQAYIDNSVINIKRDSDYSTTQAISKEKAISNICDRIKTAFNKTHSYHIGLFGTLYVNYFSIAETYAINTRDYSHENPRSIVLDTIPIWDNLENYRKNSENKIRFHEELMSLEQAKYLQDTIEESKDADEKAAWMLIYEDGEIERIYRELEILGEYDEYYVEYNDEIYWYDDKDGYYYKDRDRNSDKLKKCA